MRTPRSLLPLTILTTLLARLPAAALSGEPGIEPAAPATNRAVIICREPTFDFGRMDNTNTVTHTFVVSNAGQAVLLIGDIRASCGCTVATVSRREVPPAGTAEVTARLNLAGRRGDQVKTITVTSNDPATPQLQLWMKGIALVDVGLEPAYVNFGQIKPGDTPELQVELLSRDPAVGITGVSGSTDRFQVQTVTNAAGVANRLKVRAVPPFAGGFTRADFTVTTTHPKIPVLQLPVSALVPDPVYVIPKWLLIRGATNGPGAQRTILVRPGSIPALTLQGVDVPDPRIKVKTETIGQSNYRVTFSDIPIDPALHGKQVVIRTDARGYERVPVEIRVTVEPPAAPAVQITPGASSNPPPVSGHP